MPVAAHSFEYMLMVVKPGIVLTSLTKISPVPRDEQEIDARHAGAVDRAERGNRQAAHFVGGRAVQLRRG